MSTLLNGDNSTIVVSTLLNGVPLANKFQFFPQGATAPQCAGVIHNDMERCFIKAEVVACADFLQHTPENQKSMAAVKAAGKHRQEGKNYVAKDGDIIHIMHNAKR